MVDESMSEDKGIEDNRTIIVEQLFYQVDMSENHAPAAISLKLELVQRVALEPP